MQRKTPEINTREEGKIKYLEDEMTLTDLDLRIGRYYRLLKDWQKKRFDRLTKAIAREYGINVVKTQTRRTLIRHLAFLILRIEEAELELLKDSKEKYDGKIEKWLLQARKEFRGGLRDLDILCRVKKKKDKVVSFDDFRNQIRSEEGLEPTETQLAKDGHDRRYYDEVTRTTQDN